MCLCIMFLGKLFTVYFILIFRYRDFFSRSHAINWEETFYLNLLMHNFKYHIEGKLHIVIEEVVICSLFYLNFSLS